MLKNILKFAFGFLIILAIYFVSYLLIKCTHLRFPPVILGLIIFTLCLHFGLIKENWIDTCANYLVKNMGILFVPFIVGLVAYKTLLAQNLFVIFLVVFMSTTFIIVTVGLFVEYGLKFLRLHKIRKAKND